MQTYVVSYYLGGNFTNTGCGHQVIGHILIPVLRINVFIDSLFSDSN